MEITKELKKRFCKNCNIPINIFEEPYFTNRLELMDKQYNTMAQYSKFLGSIENFNTEQEYYEHYNKVKDNAISFIKSNPEYEEFNNTNYQVELNEWHKKCPVTSNSIYKPTFDGKQFISIDMKCANFKALQNYSWEIFGGADTWESFLRKFTNDIHLIESKYVRQVILGNCNPKHHISYEKLLMYNLFSMLSDLIETDIVSLSNDEIIIQDNGKIEEIEHIVKKYELNTGLKFKVESFTLYYLGKELGYIKLHDDMSYELKCVDNDYIHMIIRLMEHGKIIDDDLSFCYKGDVAAFNGIPKCIEESSDILKFYYEYKRIKIFKNLIKDVFID